MGNCISAGPLHHEANIWGEEQFVKGSRKGLGTSSNSALLHQGSRDGVNLLLRRTSHASVHRSTPPPHVTVEPYTLCPNTSAGAREMLCRQPSHPSTCKLFIGAPCEESQVPSNSPYPSPGFSQPRKKASPHPLSVPLANSGFPEACIGSLPRRSSASTLSSPHQLHTQCQTSHMRRGSLPLCPSSVVPSPVTSPRGPKDSRGSPLLHSDFPRDSALSVSTSSPHSSKPLADTSLTPSHSLCTYPTAHTVCPPAAPPNSTKFSPAKSPKSADFSRTLRRQPSKPFALSRPGSPPCLAPNLTAPITHQGPSTDAPVHAALQPAHTEAQQQLPYTLGAGKDVCRCEALGSGPTSSAMPCSPCSAQASPTSILPSPFAQQWLAEAEAEGEHGSGISGGDRCGGLPAEARDAFEDEGQRCIVQTRSHGHAPLFVSSTVRHTSAGSYHRGLQSAQHSLRQQVSHDMPSGGADDWASMHMAMAVAAELGENIPPSSMEVVAVIAEAEARASNACQPLSGGNTNPGAKAILKRNASTGSSQLASRSATSTFQADFSCSTSGAFAQAPFDAPIHSSLRHCCSDRISPHSSAGGRHSALSHEGRSTLSHTGSARTTPGSRNSNCRSSGVRRSPAATLAQLGSLATRPSIASSTTHVADAVISLTHAFTRRSQCGSVDSTTLLGSDKPTACDGGLKVLDTTPWTKDPSAATPSCASSPRRPTPLPRRPSFPLFLPGNKQPSPAAPHSDAAHVGSPQKLGRLGSLKAALQSSRSSCPSGAADVLALLAPSASEPLQGTPVVAEAGADAPSYTTGATSNSPLRGLKPPQHRFRARQNSLPPILQHSELRLGDDEAVHKLPPCTLSLGSSRPTPTSAPLFCRMSEGPYHQQQQRQGHPGGAGNVCGHACALGGMHATGSRRALTHTRSVSQLLVGQPNSGGRTCGSSPPQSVRDEHELVALQGFFSPRAAAMKNSQSLARVPETLDHSFDSSGSDEVANL